MLVYSSLLVRSSHILEVLINPKTPEEPMRGHLEIFFFSFCRLIEFFCGLFAVCLAWKSVGALVMGDSSFLSIVSGGAMIVAPPLPFLAQYMQMKRTRNAKGFSRAGPLLLLASNALRLAFWFGKQYSLVLVVQSLALIAVQLMLLHLSVTLNKASSGKKRSEGGLSEMKLNEVLEWDSFMNYLYLFVGFTVASSVVGLLFQNVSFIVELLGVVSVLCEAMLAIPQILQNRRTHSVAGVSMIMVGGWFLGDGYKTIYFIATSAPAQFILCGTWQLCADLVLGAQFLMYRNVSGAGSPEALPM